MARVEGIAGMNITQGVVDSLDNWQIGERHNHWRHEGHDISIRATCSDMGRAKHIAPTEGWVVEIYPVENWPIVRGDYDDITRFEPDDAHGARRTITALIIGVAIADSGNTKNDNGILSKL